jgi:hypothetical protein
MKIQFFSRDVAAPFKMIAGWTASSTRPMIVEGRPFAATDSLPALSGEETAHSSNNTPDARPFRVTQLSRRR